jgi:hypothetical protein
VAPDVRCPVDATRREPNASWTEPPRWFSKIGRTHAPPRRERVAGSKEPPRWPPTSGVPRTPPGASRTPAGRSHLGGSRRLAGRTHHPGGRFSSPRPKHGSTGRPLHPHSPSPAPRPVSRPRITGLAFGPGPRTGETSGWKDEPSGSDRWPGRVSLGWAARREQGTRTSWTCVTETRHRVRGGANRHGREKRRRRTEAGVEARDEVHCR